MKTSAHKPRNIVCVWQGIRIRVSSEREKEAALTEEVKFSPTIFFARKPTTYIFIRATKVVFKVCVYTGHTAS